MKLLYCPECGDIFNLTTTEKSCSCGATSGRYLDYLNAVYKGGIPLGITNTSFENAIARQAWLNEEKEIPFLGANFEAFVIPSNCKTFKKEKQKEPPATLELALESIDLPAIIEENRHFLQSYKIGRVGLFIDRDLDTPGIEGKIYILLDFKGETPDILTSDKIAGVFKENTDIPLLIFSLDTFTGNPDTAEIESQAVWYKYEGD